MKRLLTKLRNGAPGALIWPLAVIGALGLQIALILVHQPFADEWQAVQIAVQAPDLAGLLENLHYETHPPAWYIFLRVLATIVGPHNALMAASLLLALPVQALILTKSPFPKWARLAIVLSTPMLFEFSVVSRGHTLGLALIFASLALWPGKRLVWLPIALMPAVDFLYGVVSIALIAFRWQDRKLWWPGIAGWLALSLFSAWSIIPAQDYVPVYGPTSGDLFHIQMAVMRLSINFLPLQGSFTELMWGAGPPDLLMMTLWLPLLATLAMLARGRWAEGAALFGMAAIMFGFSAFLYPLQNRHVLLLSTLMIVVLWRRGQSGEVIVPLVRIWLVLGAVAGLWTAYFGLTRSFERSAEVAQYIRDAGLSDEHWVAVPDMAGQGVSALTQIKFEKPGRACMQDFVRWDAPLEMRKEAGYLPFLRAASAQRGRFYILSNKVIPQGEGIALIKSFPEALDGKESHIYAVGAQKSRAQLDLPDCVPGTRPFGGNPKL